MAKNQFRFLSGCWDPFTAESKGEDGYFTAASDRGDGGGDAVAVRVVVDS